MEFTGCLPFIFFGLIAGAILVVQYLMAQERRRQWRSVADALGFRLLKGPSAPTLLDFLGGSFFGEVPSIVGTYPHSLFQRGHHRRAPNIMEGNYAGYHAMCFDYQYTVGSGKNSHTDYFLCVLLPSPVPFARLSVRPEGIGDKIAGFLGMGDIQFESDDFNRRFSVTCDDPRFAFGVLHPRSMELLMDAPGVCLEGVGSNVLFYLPRSTESAGGLRWHLTKLLQFGAEFMAHLPQYLARPQGRQAQSPQDGGS